MNAAKDLRKQAKDLGWQLCRSTGKHEIWQSLSGYRMPLPSSPGKGRTMQNVIAKLRRYA